MDVLYAILKAMMDWLMPVAAAAVDTGAQRACARPAARVTVSAWRHNSPIQSSPPTPLLLTSLGARLLFFCSSNSRPTVQRSSSPVSRRPLTSFPVPVWGRETRRHAAATAVALRRFAAAAPCWWRPATAADVAGPRTRPRRAPARCRGMAVAPAGRGRRRTSRRSCVHGQVATELAPLVSPPRLRSDRRRAVSLSTWGALRRTVELLGDRGSVTSASVNRRGLFDVETASPRTTSAAPRPAATRPASCRRLRVCLAYLRHTPVSASLPGPSSSSRRCVRPEACRRRRSQSRLNSRPSSGSRSKTYRLLNWHDNGRPRHQPKYANFNSLKKFYDRCYNIDVTS